MANKKKAAEAEALKPEMEITPEPAEEVKAEPEKKEKPELRMYVGPTIANIGMIQNRVYSEIPEAAQEVIRETPVFGNLLIPISDYPMANEMLRTRNGYIYSAFQMALNLKK